MKASTICGSDIRCIYHEHLGKGPEGYQGVIAGHEPCGQIVEDRAGMPPVRRRRSRHRVSHLRLRGLQRLPARLHDLVHQREVSPRVRLAARRRHGGVPARRREGPDRTCPMNCPTPTARRWPAASARSTKGLQKIGICGDHDVLDHRARTGRAGDRRALPETGSAPDHRHRRVAGAHGTGARSGPVRRGAGARAGQRRARCCDLTGGRGVERAVDCSANDAARATAIRATRKWGRIVFLGEGGRVEFNPSPDIIHDQKTIYGSWVTSTWLMEELVERLVRWNLHPADLMTHRFALDRVGDAYALMAPADAARSPSASTKNCTDHRRRLERGGGYRYANDAKRRYEACDGRRFGRSFSAGPDSIDCLGYRFRARGNR